MIVCTLDGVHTEVTYHCYTFRAQPAGTFQYWVLSLCLYKAFLLDILSNGKCCIMSLSQ